MIFSFLFPPGNGLKKIKTIPGFKRGRYLGAVLSGFDQKQIWPRGETRTVFILFLYYNTFEGGGAKGCSESGRLGAQNVSFIGILLAGDQPDTQ
jgi:hypothetical protein